MRGRAVILALAVTHALQPPARIQTPRRGHGTTIPVVTCARRRSDGAYTRDSAVRLRALPVVSAAATALPVVSATDQLVMAWRLVVAGASGGCLGFAAARSVLFRAARSDLAARVSAESRRDLSQKRHRRGRGAAATNFHESAAPRRRRGGTAAAPRSAVFFSFARQVFRCATSLWSWRRISTYRRRRGGDASPLKVSSGGRAGGRRRTTAPWACGPWPWSPWARASSRRRGSAFEEAASRAVISRRLVAPRNVQVAAAASPRHVSNGAHYRS